MEMEINNDTVEFFILLGDKIFLSPTINKRNPLAKLFEVFAKKDHGPAGILTNIPIHECKLYRFAEPVPSKGMLEEIANSCLATRDVWVKVSAVDEVKDLVDDHRFLCSKFVCLSIELPSPQGATKEEQATSKLRELHGAIFSCLQITLTDINRWQIDDIEGNLKGGNFLRHGQSRLGQQAIQQVESSLVQQRPRPAPQPRPSRIGLKRHRSPTSTIAEQQQELLFEFVSSIEHVDQYFSPPTNVQPHTAVQVMRECVAFCALHLSREDVRGVFEEPSSAFKGSHLSSHFFVPPFTPYLSLGSQTKLKFQPEMQWDFPMFLRTPGEQFSWARYTPRSDFGVFVDRFLCPLMICEVISKGHEDDHCRMLVQAIAVVRAGHYLQKSHIPDRPFFVTAVYLTKGMMVSRYIVMQTNEEGKVSIAEAEYNLLQAEQQVGFLKEMFNLKARMQEMASNLDPAKRDELQAVNNTACGLPTLTTHRTTMRKGACTLHGVQEDPRERHVGTPFSEDSEIVARLDTMGYEIDRVLVGYEHVAVISQKFNHSNRRILKLTDCEQEVEILQHLARIDSPDNHTIADVQVWTLSSGRFVIHTRSGGGHLTDLYRPAECLWSATMQLVEGVTFMHQHGVAHRDIKPSNVLIPRNGGRLSIIDYSVATFIGGPGSKSSSFVGTEGYMAPEIRSGPSEDTYDPLRADAWSCGKTLNVLCHLCNASMHKAFIVEISEELMNTDPIQRPTMSQVLSRMAAFESLESVVNTYPVSGMAPYTTNGGDERVQPEEGPVGKQGALRSMVLKVKENVANGKSSLVGVF